MSVALACPFSSSLPPLPWRQKACICICIYRLRQGLVSQLGTVPSESSRSKTSARMELAPTSGVFISSLSSQGGLYPTVCRGTRQEDSRIGGRKFLPQAGPCSSRGLKYPAPTPQLSLLQRQGPRSLKCQVSAEHTEAH